MLDRQTQHTHTVLVPHDNVAKNGAKKSANQNQKVAICFELSFETSRLYFHGLPISSLERLGGEPSATHSDT